MKRIRIVIVFVIMGILIPAFARNVSAAVVDYSTKSVEELDELIAENNVQIQKKSKKITKNNNNCIGLIQQFSGTPTEEFLEKIQEYTEKIKNIADSIKKQKKTCNSRKKKVQKLKNQGKKEATIKKWQIKYIKSQNKLIGTLDKATKETKSMSKYLKKRNKGADTKLDNTTKMSKEESENLNW